MKLDLPISGTNSFKLQSINPIGLAHRKQFNFKKGTKHAKMDFVSKADRTQEKQFSGTRSTLSHYSSDSRHRYEEEIVNHIENDKKISETFQLPYFKKEKRNEGKLKRKKHDSPIKKTRSYKLLHSFFKNAQPTKHCPVDDEVDEKKKILHNIYYKNEKYYYSSKISFQTILRKIYYENYKIKNVKEYIIPCFKRLKNVKNYFDILFREAKSFSETIKKRISKKLTKILVREEDYSSEAADIPIHRSIILPFSKAIRQYRGLIDLLFNSYQHLENVNYEIEKLTKIYLENYIEKKESIDFDTLFYHKSMFINNVYKDEKIHVVIEELYEFFCRNSFYSKNFRDLVEKVSEIYDNLEYGFDYDDECPEECPEESYNYDSFFSDSSETRTETTRYGTVCEDKVVPEEKKTKKKRKKKKKNKKQVNQSGQQDRLNPQDRLKFTEFCRRLSAEKLPPRRLKLVRDQDGTERLC